MGETVVVIGNFDGVHPGHRELLRVAHALEPDLPLVAVTFWPHPMAVLRPDDAPKLLTSLKQRIALLKQAGATRVEVIEFTREFAGWSPARFVEEIVVPLRPARVVVGENFRFGYRAAGDVDAMRELSQGRFEVDSLALVRYGDEEMASSLIRQALAEGDVERANEHLGRPFRFAGIVKHGDHRGRALGYPTANLPVPADMACPADGVYAGWVTRLDGRDEHGDPLKPGVHAARWPAAISVGTNPTFDGLQRRVESYVLDRDDLELYDAPLAVEFVAHLRGQITFAGVEALIDQMRSDVVRCREILAANVTSQPPLHG